MYSVGNVVKGNGQSIPCSMSGRGETIWDVYSGGPKETSGSPRETGNFVGTPRNCGLSLKFYDC